MTAPVVQPCWKFIHRDAGSLSRLTAYALRQHLKGTLPSLPLGEVTVRTALNAVTLSARTTEAAAWMLQNMAAVMEGMAKLAGQVTEVEPVIYEPAVKPSNGASTVYTVHRLIVSRAKPGRDWSAWREPKLTPDGKADLIALIRASLRSELQAWRLPNLSGSSQDEKRSDGLVLIDEGRPMVISADDGPRGMARLDVKFLLDAHIEGDLYLGHHTLLGHGLMRRGGAVAHKHPQVAATLQTDFAAQG